MWWVEGGKFRRGVVVGEDNLRDVRPSYAVGMESQGRRAENLSTSM